MEKVTVNGKSDTGKNIYDVGKRKVILTFSSLRRRRGNLTMEKSNGKYRESNKNPLTIDL